MKRAFVIGAVLLPLSVSASQIWQKTGIYPFDNHLACPLDGRLQQAQPCNRIALYNDQSRVELDSLKHEIRISSNQLAEDDGNELVDILLQGIALRGQAELPVSLHFKVKNQAGQLVTKFHVHSPVEGSFEQAELEPYRIWLNNQLVLSPEQALTAVKAPSLAAKLAGDLIQVRDHSQLSIQGLSTADFTLALGLGPLSKSVLRVRWQLDKQQPLASLEQYLQQTDWQIELTALTSQLPAKVVRQELFLYGVADQPVLEPLMQGRWPKGESLIFGRDQNHGFIQLGAERQPYPQIVAVSQRFLANSFIGLILAQQQRPSPK